MCYISKMPNVCVMKNCWPPMGRRLLRFPKDRTQQISWLQNLNIPELLELSATELHIKKRVCDRHFRTEDIISAHYPGSNNRALRPGSVPIVTITQRAVPSVAQHISNIPEYVITPEATVQAIIQQAVPAIGSFVSEDIPALWKRQAVKNTKKIISTTQETRVSIKRKQVENVASGVVARLKRKLLAKSKLIQNLKGKLREVRGLKIFHHVLKQYNLHNINSVGKRFLLSIWKLEDKKAKGKHYNGDEKVICLAIFKQNPCGYRFLRTFLPLPSPHTLTKIGKIPLWPGINNIIFKTLKERATKLSTREKFCSLIFDEMSLRASLTYMSKYGIITGIEDFGGDRGSKKFADNVLVFMLRGILCKWAQPVAFYFCESTTKTLQLTRCIKDVLNAVFDTGFKVQVTVCDQDKTNVAAINCLIGESRAASIRSGREFRSVGYYFKEWEIFHVYDPPHLIESIRNNLLTKDLTFTMDETFYKASWADLTKFYTWDCNRMKICHKLTDRHIIPQHIPKMKVKYAVQVLSKSVYTAINNAVKYEHFDLHQLDSSVLGTAKCCYLFDQLFDSVNSRRRRSTQFKPLDCVLSEGSTHLDFWRNVRKVLGTMKFVDAQGRSANRPACIANWAFTLRSFEALWMLLITQGFTHVSLRNINQESLDNFCSRIRSHEGCNTNPTCAQFIASYKTMLVNSMVLPRKKDFNCEDDEESMLTLLKEYLDDSQHVPITLVEYPKIDNLTYLENITRPLNTKFLEYVEGFVGRRLSKFMKCAACKTILIDPIIDSIKYTLIREKEFEIGALTRPSTAISVAFRKVCNVVWNIIPNAFNRRGMRDLIINYINEHIDLSFLNCCIHNLSNDFVKNVVDFLIFKWVESNNKKLAGLYLRVRLDMDHVETVAIAKFRKINPRRRIL